MRCPSRIQRTASLRREAVPASLPIKTATEGSQVRAVYAFSSASTASSPTEGRASASSPCLCQKRSRVRLSAVGKTVIAIPTEVARLRSLTSRVIQAASSASMEAARRLKRVTSAIAVCASGLATATMLITPTS